MKHGSVFWSVLLLVLVTVCSFPAVADELTLTDDDNRFLADITGEGVPLLYEIPAALKTGFFNGADEAIPTIASEKKAELETFTGKISAYTLSPETDALRDAYLKTAETYLADINEYGTLVNSCGSCVATINEMYPSMKDDAGTVNGQVITFFQKFDLPIPA